jgi:hypothetical protein
MVEIIEIIDIFPGMATFFCATVYAITCCFKGVYAISESGLLTGGPLPSAN